MSYPVHSTNGRVFVAGDALSVAGVGAAPNAAGASLAGAEITLQPADATNPGVVTAAAQTFGGAKTFAAGLVSSDLVKYDGVTGLTAFATGGQASATALTGEVNFVTTVASAGDSVKLPTAALGLRVVVFNKGAEACDVFPASGAAIDALGANNAYSLASGTAKEFWGVSATLWYSK